MRSGIYKILVTGGAGFIGSAFVRLLARDCPPRGLSLAVVDSLTYAGDLARLKEAAGKYKFYKADIRNKNPIEAIFRKERPQIVVHFAAATHVDRSIQDASPFIETNVKGTQVILDASRKYEVKRFIHISTDEIYGEIKKGKFSEDSPLKPNSPYAASKAAGDLLVKSYIRTYNLPAIIIRPSNNYGPWQYPEKLIPLAILKVVKEQKIPVYADGRNVREWLYVEDCVKGIWRIMQKGRTGEVYNLGSDEEQRNIDVVKAILRLLKAGNNMIQFVKDRPGHDIRYHLDSKEIFNKIGWRPQVKFQEGINLTVNWYLRHNDWLLSKRR